MAKDGVTHYTIGHAEFAIPFPNDMTACFYCPHCRKDAVGREMCGITREILPFSHTERGTKCPIVGFYKEGSDSDG